MNDLPTPPPKRRNEIISACTFYQFIANLPQPLPPFPVNVQTNIVMINTKNTNANQNSTNKSVGSTYNAIPATSISGLGNKNSTNESVCSTYATTTGEEVEPPPASSATSMRFGALGIQCVCAALADVAGPCVCVLFFCFWRARAFRIYLH